MVTIIAVIVAIALIIAGIFAYEKYKSYESLKEFNCSIKVIAKYDKIKAPKNILWDTELTGEKLQKELKINHSYMKINDEYMKKVNIQRSKEMTACGN